MHHPNPTLAVRARLLPAAVRLAIGRSVAARVMPLVFSLRRGAAPGHEPPVFRADLRRGQGQRRPPVGGPFPGVPAKLAELVIEKWDPVTLPKLDVLFASLPTGY